MQPAPEDDRPLPKDLSITSRELPESGEVRRPASHRRRLSGTRLSFTDTDVHIPRSPEATSRHDPLDSSQVSFVESDVQEEQETGENPPRRNSLLKTLHSLVLGTPHVRSMTAFSLGARSLSNTINISGTSRLDMSLFQTKKKDPWAKTGVTVATNNLSYFVQTSSAWRLGRGPRRRKALLKHITVAVAPGEVAYVMGPSGAGKSTLLDALAGRIKRGTMSGQIFFNGQERDAHFYESSAYVRQDDVHIPNLTVEETLYFAARLKLGKDYSDDERQSRVLAVADLLGLNACFLSTVGDKGMRGISGGQLKRLSVAVEIMSMPSLIFLDEPTSGLDSVMSLEVMKFTSRLAGQNRTIFATIHQPSLETFALASKLIIVTAGRVGYSGPASEAVRYFTSPRLGYSSHGYSNPADMLIAVVSGAEASVNMYLGSAADPKKLSELYEASEYFQPSYCTSGTAGSKEAKLVRPSGFPTSIPMQCATLLSRFWLAQSRQWEFLVAQVGKNIVVAGTCGTIFWGQGRVAATNYFSNSSFNVSSLWYFALLYTVLSCLQIIPILFFYNCLYNRERAANTYSTFAYWAANAVVSIPLILVSHIVFVELAYWLVGLYPNLSAHLYAMFVAFLNNLISFFLAQFMAAIAPSAEIALAMFPLTFLFLGSFAGFTIPLRDLPIGWKWASYISYPRWTYEGLIINEFHHRPDREAVLHFYTFDHFDKFQIIPILFGFMVIANLLVYLGLLPSRSALRIEEPTLPGDSPKEVKIIEEPIIIPSPTTFGVHDFAQRSARVPNTKGVSLVFRDLEYSIGKTADRAIKILKGVSGHVHAGQMCALMGGSGAGKSTLLDLLAYRKTSGLVTGEYYIGGKPEKPSSKWCSYVTQDNVHISLFTVKETLRYAARLRLDEHITMDKRIERANDVMRMLGLEEVADVRVGDSMTKGISGGQCRRLSIGVEIVQLPDVVFLDEPTTGLDSQISLEVMSSVRNIANHNRTVVCTIHSPAESVFKLFDSLILLALGRQTYFGPISRVLPYFSQPALNWQMPRCKNPADFIMEANQGLLVGADGSRKTIRELNQLFLASDHYLNIEFVVEQTLQGTRTEADIEKGGKNQARRIRSNSVMEHLVRADTYPRSILSQMRILSVRQFHKISKMRSTLVYTLVRNIVVAVFHGSLYTHLSNGAIQSRLSLLFFAIMFVMMACQSFIPNIFDDRLLFYRERGAAVYGSVPYWFSSSLPYIPQSAVASVTYCSIVYVMAGLNTAPECYGYFILVVTICGLCGLYFCQLVSLLVPTPQISVSIFPAALFVVVAFAGFVVRLPSLPSWLGSWAPTISFARWAFQGLVINEFDGNSKIEYGEIIPQQIPNKYQYFIQNFGFENYDKWRSIPILTLSLAVLWLTCYLPLRFVNFEKR